MVIIRTIDCGDSMAKFGLWWYRYNGEYTQVSNATPDDLYINGFDFAVALDGEGTRTKFSGSLYSNGYNDDRELALRVKGWLDGASGIPYLVTIPYFTPSGGKRGLSYWEGWIDGVASIESYYFKGFYWSLEDAKPIQSGRITEYEINAILGRIQEVERDLGKDLQFIWIPTLRSVLCSGTITDQDGDGVITNNDVILWLDKYSEIALLSKYFDYVFPQPGYYFADKIGANCNQIEYTYSLLVDILRWIRNSNPSNIYIEMEADGAVRSSEYKLQRACDYVSAQETIGGSIWENRAYYFDWDINIVSYIRNMCPKW